MASLPQDGIVVSSEDEIEGTTATRIEVEHARASRWETAAVALCSRTWGQWTRMDRRHAYLGDCHLSISWHLGAAASVRIGSLSLVARQTPRLGTRALSAVACAGTFLCARPHRSRSGGESRDRRPGAAPPPDGGVHARVPLSLSW